MEQQQESTNRVINGRTGFTSSRENLALDTNRYQFETSTVQDDSEMLEKSQFDVTKMSMNNLSSAGSVNSSTKSKEKKKWSISMVRKSSTIKLDKQDTGESGIKVGSLFLSSLQGLTKSKSDLLKDYNQNQNSDEFTEQSSLPRESLAFLLKSKLTEGEVVKEFERIPKKKVDWESHVNIASMVENVPRNRFKDVVPYDENRVKITNEKDNRYGYVNASHISATVGNSQRFYIAAQGPLPNTVHNFWAMVLECDVHLIVMLTEVSGVNKPSACIPYWPQNEGSSLEIGDFTITKIFSSKSTSYKTTTLKLGHIPSGKTRRVWHIQFSGWQDHGCPDDASEFLAFCEEMGTLRRHTMTEISSGVNSNTPVLVHCSAGVGRTGVTILTDILLYCIDHNIHIDIPKVLSHLRQQRMLMIQTVTQYKFIHSVLIQYLSKSRLI